MFFRFLFSVSLLAWSMLLSQSHWSLILLMTSGFILAQSGTKIVTFMKIGKVLLWLFIPILFFQSLFTPGNYIVFSIALPITYEGIQQGLLLCMHLATVYFAAFAVMRLVSYSEWLKLIRLIPLIYPKLFPTLVLTIELKKVITSSLQARYKQWYSAKHKYKRLPFMIADAMRDVVTQAENKAAYAWQSWDAKAYEIDALQADVTLFRVSDMLFVFPLVTGWVLIWLN